MTDQFNFGVLVLRLVFGLFLAYHGYNKVFGGGGLAGTARWFGSIGMRWPQWQARIPCLNHPCRHGLFQRDPGLSAEGVVRDARS